MACGGSSAPEIQPWLLADTMFDRTIHTTHIAPNANLTPIAARNAWRNLMGLRSRQPETRNVRPPLLGRLPRPVPRQCRKPPRRQRRLSLRSARASLPPASTATKDGTCPRYTWLRSEHTPAEKPAVSPPGDVALLTSGNRSLVAMNLASCQGVTVLSLSHDWRNCALGVPTVFSSVPTAFNGRYPRRRFRC